MKFKSFLLLSFLLFTVACDDTNSSKTNVNYRVTVSDDGHVTVDPSSVQTVKSGKTQTFIVTANTGFETSHTVKGTCATGTWSGTKYTTGAIIKDCTVTFSANATSSNSNDANDPQNGSGTLYAYTSCNGGGNHVRQCTLNSDGSFNACTVTPASGEPTWQPIALEIAIVNGTKYAYVGDNMSHLYQCTFNSNGTFNVCSITPATGAPSWTPIGISVQTINGATYGYVVNGLGVYRCTVNSDGTFNTCALTPSSGGPSWQPNGVTIATVNGTQYAYVGSIGQNLLYQCTLNSDGTFNTCALTPSSQPSGWGPGYTIFPTINGTQYAYVGDSQGSQFQCTLNSDGTLGTCTQTPLTPAGSTFSMDFATVNGVQYGYIAQWNGGHYYRCTLNSNGSMNTCTNVLSSGEPVGWAPWGLQFAKF